MIVGEYFMLSFLLFLATVLALGLVWFSHRITTPTILGAAESGPVLDQLSKGQLPSIIRRLHDDVLDFRKELALQKEALALCRKSEAEMMTRIQELREQIDLVRGQVRSNP